MSQLNLTEKERAALATIAKNYNNNKFVPDGQVEPSSNSQVFVEFVADFLSSRGFDPGHATEDIGLYRFSHVNMHVDSIHSKAYWTLMIPVKGRGELCSFGTGEDITSYKFRTRGDWAAASVFNDHKPHAFVSESKVCYAILVDIKASVARKLLA